IVALVVTHGPAWAGNGWYLLVPSLSEYNEANDFLKGYRVLVGEPLSKWNHAGAYDSAVECDTDRNGRIRREHSVYTMATDEYRQLIRAQADPFVLKTQRRIVELDNAQVDALQASRCISSDDSRLR